MKPLSIRIQVDAFDAYVYMGSLYIILTDGRIVAVNLFHLLYQLDYSGKLFDTLRFCFLQSDTLGDSKNVFLLKFPEVRDVLMARWAQLESDEFIIALDELETEPVTKGQDGEVPLDFKIYGRQLFVGYCKGLLWCPLEMDVKYRPIEGSSIKAFDGKSASFSASNGCLAVSSDFDGLMAIPDVFVEDRLAVCDKPLSTNRSIRSAWTGYDLITYSSNKEFSMIQNSFVKRENSSEYGVDRSESRLVAEELGIGTVSMDQMLSGNQADLTSDLAYCFNGSERSFFIKNDGSVVFRNIKDDKLSGRSPRQINSRENLPAEKPLNAMTFPGGCVVEYFDSVYLLHRGEPYKIGDEPVFSTRTYTGSLRYSNLITQVTENEIILTSLNLISDLRPRRRW